MIIRSVPWRKLVPLLVWLGLALAPAPAGLSTPAWRYFALFAGIVVAQMVEPVPAAVVGLAGVTLAAGLGYVGADPSESVKWALAGFSDTTVWLIFGAFVFSLGYEKSGLGRRIALLLVRALGGRALGLGYAITLGDLALAPFTPSNTARSAGTIFPIIRNLPGLYGSEPGPTARRIGSYVMWTGFAATAVTSSMFFTGLAPNLLAFTLVRQATSETITWGQWLVGFLPMGVLLVAFVPWLIYKIYPPEIRTSAEVPRWAGEELARMGPLTCKEWTMGGLGLLALLLWILGGKVVNATETVLIMVVLLVLTDIVTWDDILAHRQAWNMLVWFATLVALADGLAKVGFVAWVSRGVIGLVGGLSPTPILILLVVFFFLVHYLFASLVAHTTAVLPLVLAAGAAIPGMKVRVLALLLCYSIGLMGVISPYATGPAPVYYGSGFIPRKHFWTLGLVFGLFYLGMLIAVGLPYLTWLTARGAG